MKLGSVGLKAITKFFAHELSKLMHGEKRLVPTDAEWQENCHTYKEFVHLPIGWHRVAIALYGAEGADILRAILPVFKTSWFGYPGDTVVALELMHAWWCINVRDVPADKVVHAMWRDRMRVYGIKLDEKDMIVGTYERSLYEAVHYKGITHDYDDNLENEWPFVNVEQAKDDVMRALCALGRDVTAYEISIYLDKTPLHVMSALEMAQDDGLVVCSRVDSKGTWSIVKVKQ